ncbi:MAG: glycosyltransferase family 4 protein [Cyanobacteria bacterium J06632_22]
MSTFDTKGGAAIAASRLHDGLRQQGVHSTLLVREQLGRDPQVIGPSGRLQQGWAKTKGVLDALPLQLYRQRDPAVNFFPQWLPGRTRQQVAEHRPDILNLHWVSGGFVAVEALRGIPQPVVWTLHDMWPMTGGCHYSGTCDRFQQTCGQCPQLGSHRSWDLSRWTWRRKARAWHNLSLHLVSPSQWLADQAQKSMLFRDRPVTVIPNGLDLDLYRPLSQATARVVLRLPPSPLLILFGAANATTDDRKGFSFLQPTLRRLQHLLPDQEIELVIFGATRPEHPPDFPYRTHYLGVLSDAPSLVLTYAAADVFLLPARQDNLPNTIVEALACGVPCVGFDQGGLPDLIQPEYNGKLAKPYDGASLAQGLRWVLADAARRPVLRANARAVAEQRFGLSQQAARYRTLFEGLLP